MQWKSKFLGAGYGQLMRRVAKTTHNSMSYANAVSTPTVNVLAARPSRVQHWR
jgi:hypothetical protein